MIPEYLQCWADAVTRQEGWFAPNAQFPRGSESFRHNNPGNIVLQGVYATFGTYAAGRAALIADLTAKFRRYADWTLLKVMQRYCPAPDGSKLTEGNDPEVYAAHVATALGVSPDTLVKDIPARWAAAGKTYVPAVFKQVA